MDQLGKTKLCTTFLDDLIAAIAAASASQIANKNKKVSYRYFLGVGFSLTYWND